MSSLAKHMAEHGGFGTIEAAEEYIKGRLRDLDEKKAYREAHPINTPRGGDFVPMTKEQFDAYLISIGKKPSF